MKTDKPTPAVWHSVARGHFAGGLDSAGELRDLRGLLRPRLCMPYGLRKDGYSDLFAGKPGL